jgi:hypothetical protein
MRDERVRGFFILLPSAFILVKMFGLDQTANVYTPNATDGAFTQLHKSGLVCRLAYIQPGAADVGQERENIGSRRRLLWAEDYTAPETAQVEVDGERWNVLAGTAGKLRGPDSSVVYRRCEVERAI